MSYKSIVISSGHGKLVRGASGILDEVDEARRVVEEVAEKLRTRGTTVKTFHDDTSTSQNQNLSTIVNFHNKQDRQLDISVHFNAYIETSNPMGTEVLYVSQAKLAGEISQAMSDAAKFINRGAKLRNDLYFLNNTNKPAVLLEVCFVDSEKDADLYGKYFELICDAVATTLAPDGGEAIPSQTLKVKGKVSYFGGPKDMGVSPSEGLAFIQKVEDKPELFLPYQPKGTTGLARRLNPHVHYVACRWNYDETPKEMLLEKHALVRAKGVELTAFPSDWGPHVDTDRVADLSPGLMEDLGIQTDDEAEVIFSGVMERCLGIVGPMSRWKFIYSCDEMRARGTDHPKSKLKEWQVKAIREDKTSKLKELAERFGVSIATVYSAKAGSNWKHVK